MHIADVPACREVDFTKVKLRRSMTYRMSLIFHDLTIGRNVTKAS